jgi:hypothetical protein
LSNHRAIAAVTATLRSLLTKSLGLQVIARSPDKVSVGGAAQLNIFLYLVSQNGSLRNMPIQQQVKPGETGYPPLALNLYYLLTAYGPDVEDENLNSHQLLGQAMNVLHDHPLLGAGEIQQAVADAGVDSDLHHQIERIRITPQPMSVEEMSKLWTTFQTNFRISAAYEVAVVLIESRRSAKTPLPVLKRGEEDEGATALGNMPLLPTLESVRMPGGQLSAKLNDVMTIKGFNLSGTNLKVLALPPFQAVERELAVVGTSTDQEIKAQIPNEPNNFPAGYYKLRVKLRKDGETFDRTSNTLLFSLAPRIAAPLLPIINLARDADGTATLNITPEPTVLPEQQAALLLDDLETVADTRKDKADPLVFIIRKAPVGKFLARLRVDGVDSLLIDFTKTPPEFDQNQTVTIV